MLNKLKTLREEREDGFTLIELLVVILIIGILAAIAIPVFLNQRKTANDGAVESDMKNAATQVESWIVAQKGKATPIATGAVLTEIKSGVKVSDGVRLAVRGDANGYCIKGAHANGKNYLLTADTDVALTTQYTLVANYDNANGGLNKGTVVATAAAGNPCSGSAGWLALN